MELENLETYLWNKKMASVTLPRVEPSINSRTYFGDLCGNSLTKTRKLSFLLLFSTFYVINSIRLFYLLLAWGMKSLIKKILKKEKSDLHQKNVDYILSYGEKRRLVKRVSIGEMQEQFVKELAGGK